MTTTALDVAGDCASAPYVAHALKTLAKAQGSPLEPIEPHRESFLDPWRIARGEASLTLLEFVRRALANHEQSHSLRTRARRHADQVRWEEMVEAVVCALALAVVSPPPTGRLVLPMSHKQSLPPRYRRPTQSEALPRLLEHLSALRLAVVVKGSRVGEATTIAPSPIFADMVRAYGVQPQDFGRRLDRELVVLRLSTRRGGRREKRLVDYRETLETARLRAEVAAFNDHLAKADLRFVGNAADVDTADRQLRRHFTVLADGEERFDLGGRFFGGFWQGLRKGDRKHIRIGGEPVAEVDYSAAFTHIAFALLGVEPPAVADLYRIPGLEGLGRKQIKSALNMFYFDQGKTRTRWPDDFAECMWSDPDTGEVFEGIPGEFTPARVRKAVAAHYPALAGVLCTGIGYRLMFLESEIMRRVLTKAHEMGLTVLPVHDALMVPRSVGPAVVALMEGMAKEVIGLPIPAKLSTY